jgi:hypothetical protein
MMKRVEPLIKFDSVLEYETPTPPKSVIDRLWESCEPAIDSVGGTGAALVIGAVGFIGVGVSIPGPVGATLVLIGGLILRSLLRYWSRSSRW